MNLLDAIAKSIGNIEEDISKTITDKKLMRSAPKLKSDKLETDATTKPVIQFNLFPLTLNADTYKNPHSNSNPNGDFKSLFAFRQLVDPIPQFTQYYNTSSASTENTYKQIISGAIISGDNTFAASTISNAQKIMSSNNFPNIDGTQETWCPVYAVPEDWYNTADDNRYKEISIDLEDLVGESGAYAVIGEQSSLNFLVGEDHKDAVPFDNNTKIKSVKMKYLLVNLTRPWFNDLLFKTGGWYINGQDNGFCSTGKINENAGVLPLVPTSMLLARDIVIDAEWSTENKAAIDDAKSSNKSISIGPLKIVDKGLSSEIQVIAWISSVIPYSPKK